MITNVADDAVFSSALDHGGADDALLLANARLHAVLAFQADLCAGGLDPATLPRLAAERLRHIVPCTFGAVALAKGDELEFVAIAGPGAPDHPIRMHASASLTGWSHNNRRAVRCDSLEHDGRASVLARRALDVRSIIIAPLLTQDRSLGALVAMSRAPSAFSQDDLAVLELLAGVVATAMRHAALTSERQTLLEERTAALEQDRSSTELFRALTKHSDQVVNIIDADGKIRYASPSMEHVLGYAPADVIGRRPADFVHPEDRDTLAATFDRLLRSPDTTIPALIRLRHRNGTWRYLEGFGRNLLHLPAVRGITSNARDVTERVLANERLEFQARLLDTVEQAVIAIDEAGRVTYWNAFATRLFGWSAEEASGRIWNELVPCVECGWPALVSEAELERARGGRRRESRVSVRDGNVVAIGVMTAPLVADDVRLGAVMVVEDLTEKYSLEAQLQQAQKMEALGLLAGGVAHDFNNILTSIISYTDLLMPEMPEELRGDLEEIQKAGWRAADLAGKLLSFSRKRKHEVHALDVNAELASLGGMLRRLMGEAISLSISCPASPVFVSADRIQFEQLLMNLVVNARDAMPDGGSIMVTVDAPAGDGNRVTLHVRDTGTGMDEATMARIFEPFFTTKPEGKGTGLGLSVVKGIVRQLNGTISVDSVPGKGTEFRVTLPPSAPPG